MKYNFTINECELIFAGPNKGYTGNVNTYICNFTFSEPNKEWLWFCIFKQGESTYRQMIQNNACTIPCEVLKNKGMLYIGCYATDTDVKEYVILIFAAFIGLYVK